MLSSKVVSLEEAARLIEDGTTITVSSSSGLGCPDALLRAVGERFRSSGSPKGITTLHPIAAGDMYGIGGIEHLALDGLLKRVVAGSLPSGPSSMPVPNIWQMIRANRIEAYNVPSGILYHMHREAAARRPGVLTKVGMDTFVDPLLEGARMNDSSPDDVVTRVKFDGDDWLYFPSIPVDVALIRGTTADEEGNISSEHEGAPLGIYDQALAAHNNGGIVIAQVKRIVKSGSIPAQLVRVPGVVVDRVVVSPDQMQTTQTAYDPAISGEIHAAGGGFKPVEFGPAKAIARRAAMELQNGDAVNLGFGISALVPGILHEEGLPHAVTWVIEQGAVGGMPLRGFQFGCASGARAIMASPDQFTYFHGGGFDRSLLSFLEVDGYGNVNVSRLEAFPHITAGVGGFIDITSAARHIVFMGYFTAGGMQLEVSSGRMNIHREGAITKFVPRVEHVTFSGRRARYMGQSVTYVTERCVLRLEEDCLAVTEIAPGIDLERDVLGQAHLPLRVADDLSTMDARLFREEPMGLELPVT